MTRSKKRMSARLVLLVLGLLAVPVAALTSASFSASTFDELDRGEPLGTLVSTEGEVVAGREAKKLPTPATMVWCSARDASGTAYFGSGDQGLVLAADGDKVRTVARLDRVLITALAAGPGRKLYAGTLSDGKVFEVDSQTGTTRELADLPAAQVYALSYDPTTRRIFAATGGPGKVFVINETDGRFGPYWDSTEKHLLSMVREPDNTLLVGSSDKAILYRVTNANRAVAVADFDGTELNQIQRGKDGTLYVTVNAFEQRTSGLPRFDKGEEGEGGTAIESPKNPKTKEKKDKFQAQELRPAAQSGKGAVFRITQGGNVEQLLALDKGYFTALALDTDDTLWVGEGTQGKVFLIRKDRTILTAFDLPERQVLSISLGGREAYLGTGDGGALYRLSGGPGSQPAYQTEVFDARFFSMWGTLRFQASGTLGIQSRSGNTAKPDRTWNDWLPATALGADNARLASPPARYLQIRFTWPPPFDARLRSFSAFYRTKNQLARVTDISITREGGEGDKPRTPRLKVQWKVDNPDGDPLVYRLYSRPELGVQWQLISGPDPTEKAEFSWDTEPVPDGYYRLKVVASDEKGNGQESTLASERISSRLLVDNSKPQVGGFGLRPPYLTGLARDSLSPIQRVEVSLDGKPWRLVDTQDGIYDSPSEFFRYIMPADLERGSHVLAIRAVDEAGNMGVSQVRFVK